MATFTPTPNPTNDPSYLNQSQGTERPMDRKANTGMGELFSNVAKVGGAAIGATKDVIVEDIRQNLYTRIDAERKNFGVDTAADLAATGEAPTNMLGDAGNSLFDTPPQGGKVKGAPPGVTKIADKIGPLQDAYGQGKLSESYYNARLQAIVKETRNQYPGFREEVDQIVHQITGITPANALRKSLLADMDAAERARQSANSKVETFLQSHGHLMDPETRQMYIAGDRSPKLIARAQTEIYGRQATEFGIKQSSAALELDDKMGKYDENKAYRLGAAATNEYVNDQVYNSFSAAGGAAPIVQKLMTKTGAWSADEKAEMTTNFAKVRTSMMMGVKNILAQPGYARLPEEKKAQIVAGVTSRLDDMEKAIFDQKFGIVHMNANYVSAIKDQGTRQLLESNGFWRKYQAVTSLGPGAGEFINMMMMKSEGGMSSAVKAVQHLDTLDFAVGNGSLLDAHNRQRKAATENSELDNPASYRERVVRAVTGLTEAKDVTIAENHAKVMFGDTNVGFLGKFVPSKQQEIFSTMVSPAVTEKMKEIGKTNPELWNKYVQWSWNYGFVSQFGRSIDTLVGEGKNPSSYVDIAFDPTVKVFVARPRPGFEQNVRDQQRMGYDPLSVVTDINQGLKLMDPILKADKKDVTEEFGKILQGKGWEPGKKDPSFLQTLGDALAKVSKAYGSEEGKIFSPKGKAQERAPSNKIEGVN